MWDKLPLNYYVLAGLLNFVTSAALAIVVFLRNPRSRTNRTFAFFAFAVAGWSCCYFFWLRADTSHAAEIWLRTLMVFVIFIPTTFTHFTYALLKRDAKRINVLNYLVSSLLGLSAYTNWFASDIGPFLLFPYWLKPRILFSFHTVHFFANTIHAHLLMLQAAKRNRGILRNQIFYIFFGTGIGYAAGAINYLTWYRAPIPPFLNPLVSVYVAAISYAIVKYRLMDMHLALTRTTLSLSVYAVVMGLPLLGALTWQVQLEQVLGNRWWVWLWATCALFATVAQSVNLFLQRKAEQRLLKDQRRYQQTLLSASSGMTEIRDLKRLLSLIVRVITKTVGLTHAAIFLEDAEQKAYVMRAFRHERFVAGKDRIPTEDPMIATLAGARQPLVLAELTARLVDTAPQDDESRNQVWTLSQMRSLNAGIVVPSYMQDRLIGFLVLGEKRNGKVFTDEDLVVFATLANQAAVAIENARFYEEEKERQAALFHTASLASLGVMASSMSHQVNNRFNVVSVVASSRKAQITQLLNSGTVDVEQLRKALEKDLQEFDSLADEAIRGGRIVQAIRKLTKPSKGTYELLELRHAVQAGLDVVQYKVNLKEVDFRLEMPDTLPRILGDLAQLGECFLNLIDNGFDAIEMKRRQLKPEGYRGLLWIRGYTVTESGKDWVIAEVTDNGIGVPEGQANNLFVPFFTTKATINKGTGLGLYVIKKVMDAHGGTISVTSNAGVGTTFTLRLPVLRKDQTPGTTPADGNGGSPAPSGPAPAA